LDSPPDEHLQSREWINVIDGAPLSTTEAAGRDIVDLLLEQWTVPISAEFEVVLLHTRRIHVNNSSDPMLSKANL
jgi:hypothetical protein